MESPTPTPEAITFDEFRSQILEDYRIAVTSRECSLLGRKEVLSGKAKFGIFGDGKELPQIAMAKVFRKGDFRSGYYRDQTLMMALGQMDAKAFFHGLYATTDLDKEPMSAGRQMGGHFMTHNLDGDGRWKDLMGQVNSTSDISCTAGQMPRLLGLAQASKLYRSVDGLADSRFSENGNEIAWGTIGNASTSEGPFFETFNAAGVLQVPMVISVWDDEYGISVPASHHTTKEDISEALKGFAADSNGDGYEIIKVKGWDYTALVHAYGKASETARERHVPVLIHVTELTQPQGHSTSGSHERYKSRERLEWERENDCNRQFRHWIVDNGIADTEALESLESDVRAAVREAKRLAWNEYKAPIKADADQLLGLLDGLVDAGVGGPSLGEIARSIRTKREPIKKDLARAARTAMRHLREVSHPMRKELQDWTDAFMDRSQREYGSHLYSESAHRATEVPWVKPTYRNLEDKVDGRIILRDNFDAIFAKYPNTVIFGEDTGAIGDVNQGLEGLQAKYGPMRIADTGIRETTIIGQGIGLAHRGLRPIAEIQYLDYLLYAVQTLSDDLATLHYRSVGKQKAPLIVRTRGHRLEGIWHSGSPMGALVHLLRGMHVLVPRNMTQAAGFYNTLLRSDEPALVIESLNGYRLKEIRPTNLGEFCTPIGVVQTMRNGSDITVLSYGSTLRIVEAAAQELAGYGIEVEVIDAQSLLPFDIHGDVLESVKRTNRFLIVDEDVPGGASAYLLHEVLERQGGYRFLDSAPKTLTARPHRPAYGTDGDYFSKPGLEDVFECIYGMMSEARPGSFPPLRLKP